MKKLLVLLFSLLISFNSYGEWTQLAEGVDGDKYFINIDTIKENNGSVYYWVLKDHSESSSSGDLSTSLYVEGDCNINRYRILSFVFYTDSMGKGQQDHQKPLEENGDWQYPSPSSISHKLLMYSCNFV